MSINQRNVALEMRKRVIAASAIDPVSGLKLSNSSFDSVGKLLWIAEFVIGGKEQKIGNKRSRISSFLIQYDVCVPKNTGTASAEKVANNIVSGFDLESNKNSSISGVGFDANIKEVKMEFDDGVDLYRKIILFTLDVLSIPYVS